MDAISLTDEAIIDRCLGGDKESYAILVGRHERMIYAMAYRMVGDESLAKDMTQESFLAAYTGLSLFRKGAKFSTWLYSIALNKCRDLLRKKTEETHIENVEDRLADRGINPEEMMSRTEMGQELQRAMNQLPGEYREAIILKHVQGLEYTEMAEICGQSVAALKVRTYRAREALKDLLKKRRVIDEP